MIYTTTFNPALDYITDVENFRLGMTNRTSFEKIYAGGKGINVSMVLSRLGVANTALGFIAGFTGEEIRRRVEEAGITADFITVPEGMSRINVKLRSIDGTEINGRGPAVGSAQLEEYWRKLDSLCPGDILVLAGSIPASMPPTVYSNIMARMAGRGVIIAVDASGNLLRNVLPYHPFLIKPNNHELGELFDTEITDRTTAMIYARRLQELGARNVLVSMGAKGAVLAAEDGTVCSAAAPGGKLVNAVGAGDSMVAGFLAGWSAERDYVHAFRMGLAAGSASAFTEGFAAREDIERLYDTIEIE